ncbi:hypothetical protein KMP11_06130 [Gemella sp. zg-570]|uniref:hypothetical protein n=1 Tax=Gemella sp. zg-570 TaxID=2840371 RepID=UPI001C0D2C25|nr:hypothetical protein [Gemella sp. zg-570]QWQ38527.1 hypothetical protein KMP11_06130 [Gemella sp. zg-570]
MTLKKYYLIQAVSVLTMIIIFAYNFQNFVERPKYLFIMLFPLFLLSSYVAYKIDVLRSDVASHKLSKLILLEKFSLIIIIIPIFLMSSSKAVTSYIVENGILLYIFYGLFVILLFTISYLRKKEEKFLRRQLMKKL